MPGIHRIRSPAHSKRHSFFSGKDILASERISLTRREPPMPNGCIRSPWRQHRSFNPVFLTASASSHITDESRQGWKSPLSKHRKRSRKGASIKPPFSIRPESTTTSSPACIPVTSALSTGTSRPRSSSRIPSPLSARNTRPLSYADLSIASTMA